MKLFVLINISMPEDISSIIWVKVRTKKTITCKTSRKTFLEIDINGKIVQ